MEKQSKPSSGTLALPASPEKTFGFGLRAFKRFPELIPLVSILGVACLGALSFTAYALATKPDVTVDKRKESPPWERVNPEKAQKLLTYNQEYKKIPELEQLRREIGSYKY